MSKNKKSWGFIKKEYIGCFEKVGILKQPLRMIKIKHENNKTK